MKIAVLKTPGLPQNKVLHIALSNYSSEAIKKLLEYDVKPIITKSSTLLDKRINYHTDMLLFIPSEGIIFLDKSQKSNNVKFLTIGYETRFINKAVSSPYPTDSQLNVVMLDKKMLCNPKTVSKEIITYANENEIAIIPVNQGYTKCSVCPIDRNTIITDDESIYSAADKNGIECILVKKGFVKLDGFDYGFIGGCCGMIDKDKLFFNGDINYHSDCNKIIDFLSTHSVKPIIIKDQPLTDIGGIIPLTELNTP